jgi:hypothetical protein
MRLRRDIWDKAVLFGFGLTFVLLIASYVFPDWWKVLLWASYLLWMKYGDRDQNSRLLYNLASVFVAMPVYVLTTYTILLINKRIHQYRNRY